MAAYTYKEIGREASIDNRDTLDVSVEFASATDSFQKTFRFKSVKEIEADFDARMARAIVNREAMLVREAEEKLPVITEKAVEALLVEKGFIAEGQKIADLKTLTELKAEAVAVEK